MLPDTGERYLSLWQDDTDTAPAHTPNTPSRKEH